MPTMASPNPRETSAMTEASVYWAVALTIAAAR
jgi:hypothetical protein